MKFSRVWLLVLVFVVLSVSVSFGATREEFSAMLKKAQRGDAEAQFEVARMYFDGKGVEENPKKGAEWILKAANNGHAEAQSVAGVMYFLGVGIKKDYKKAREWLEKAAPHLNDPHIDTDSAEQFYDLLGVIYEYGYGVKKDTKKAQEWYKKAGSQRGYTFFVFGCLHYSGQFGFEQDYKKAREWWEEASALKCRKASLWLGFMYELGIGVKENTKKALEWYKKAASQNNGQACGILGERYEEGRSVKADSREAFKWYAKGADLGDAQSMMAVARMYENGTGTKQDMTKAIDFYRRAALGGNEQAKKALARLNITTPTPQKPSGLRVDARPTEQPTPTPQTQTTTLFAGDTLQDRPRVAVYAFEDKTEEGKAPAKAVSDMLVSELFKAGVFRLIERERLDTITAEIRRGQSGMVDPATAAKAGRITGAQYVILGSVTLYHYSEKASGFAIPILGSSTKAKTAYVVLHLRITDVETGEIVYAYDKEGDATNKDKKSPGSSSKMIGGLLEMATRNAVEKHVAAMKVINLQ